MPQKYVEVATGLPVDRTFQYAVTGKETYPPTIGKRVLIPFRSMTRIGYIVKIEDEAVCEDPKPLVDVIDQSPVFGEDMINLAEWMKNYYYCSWGEALEAMIPGILKRGKSASVQRVVEPEIKVEPTEPFEPNKEQQEVLNEVNKCIDVSEHKVFLLHGITGSGKTEIYLQAMATALAKGKSGIVLVPEISLTPQTVERFMSRFGDKIAVFHSKMLDSAKFLEWTRIKEGKAKIVVGPRSAIFSPFEDLGLIVVDEEHEPSYKQDDVPRYHAREVAIKRARDKGIPVILGSATPSLESFHRAMKGEYRLVELTQRTEEKELPNVKLVDMRMEFETRTGRDVISRVMAEALKRDIRKKQQALIFLNRRGFSTFTSCPKCGYIMKCKKCDSPLVFHKEKEQLICHYCNFRAEPVEVCPACKGESLKYGGAGTQKVATEIKKILPEARVARMDSDTMTKRASHSKILGEFKNHEIDIIVGTQMIAKGLDFPKVTLVGVIAADANLNLPDFRSGERTFNLITQVGGRAGRGDLGGEVFVQTYTPEHYAIASAVKHNYHKFYDQEIESRRDLEFPPFVNLIKITMRGRKEEKVEKNIQKLYDKLSGRMPETKLLGPAPSPLYKLKGYYRWNIIVKTKDVVETVKNLHAAMNGFRKDGGVFLAVDVDPMSLG
ncbi:MAG: primosomal protein N' [Candidatus Omnitrophica bacterium]|nr:primosomal protein N' [Candidatus Omnitrophota bacterium]